MKRFILAFAVCVALALASSAHAQTTTTVVTTTTTTTLPCAAGVIKCDAQCDATTATSSFAVCPGGNSGISFSGTCAGAAADKNALSQPCKYIHCGGSAVCIGGPWTTTGCSGDGNCATGEVCISDNGNAGCGTGYSQCVKQCK